ncbi:class I SAM-dependent methyltransferase [Erythrobacter neustonensis]|uniref:Ubiquinone biosynthesis methyltransferase UbiE n=1 Tax=Erythrobacter neustonensis TaxID=1112 RepID=A0A192D717_9SPHN|nr:methyltransferase domain-containing protein [Erythrobacter neustonensis]ANK13662.1 ubiquinone biosynthesis methyltransferase UbiE [Erythrobacter neustonensis]
MLRRVILPFVALLISGVVTGCDALAPAATDRSETALAFPAPDRPIASVVSNQFSNEDDRDERGEAKVVMDLADIRPGMTVADIGAGEGYYTVRLAERVGADGRVLAQDISREALDRLGRRVEKDRLENISLKFGDTDNPQLPPDSFDRIFMVHMYHEVTEPYAFLWNMWPALNSGGQIVVVESDTPIGRHGMPHTMLFCEFEAVGYVLVEYLERPDIKGYFARFERGPKRIAPENIKACQAP